MAIENIRKYFLISLALAALDGCVLGIAIASSAGPDASGFSTGGAASINPVALIFGVLLFLASVVLELISWVGSLVRSGQLGQWGWFICMLLPFVNSFAFLLYVIIGPTPIAPMQPLKQPLPYQQPYGQQPYSQQPYTQPPYGQPPQYGQQINQPPYGRPD
ncbi:MAG TPA: hypothetical protein VH591_17340 [Ktedonobacterales bacterium]|jgi:hypothetical protein